MLSNLSISGRFLCALLGLGALFSGPSAQGESITNFGFFDIATTPLGVQKAAKSVFITKVVAGDITSSMRVIDVSGNKGRELLAQISSASNGIFDSMDKIVMEKQIERCEKSKDPNDQTECWFTLDIRSGTAFLLGDGRTLWTNFHVIQGFVDLLEAVKIPVLPYLKSGHRAQGIRIFVFSADGKMLVNPYEKKVTAVTIPAPTESSRLAKKHFSLDSDFVALRLPQPIGVPLKVAKTRAAAGQKVFALGYPTCTGCTLEGYENKLDFADRSPAPNSDGRGLKASNGTVWALDELNKHFHFPGIYGRVLEMDRILTARLDSQHGNSGGPWVNEDGDVVAIHTGGFSGPDRDGKHIRFSRAIVPPQFFKK